MPIAPSSRRLLAAVFLAGVLVVGAAVPTSAATASSDDNNTASSDDGTASSGGSEDGTASSGESDGTSPSADAPTAEDPDRWIIGGTLASAADWPAQVALFAQYPGERGRYFTCGGTVIDPSWVVTAAHCVYEQAVAPPQWRPSYSVRVGSADRERGGRLIPVQRVVIRPSFSPSTLRDDVALLQLSRPAGVDRNLQVASPTDIPPSGATVTAAGWGDSDGVPASQRTLLRQVDLPALNGVECQDELAAIAPEFGTPTYHSSYLCTGPLGSGGMGPCYGDSGGPLVWETGGRKVLVGIVSWGAHCASPESPSVFSKVANHSRWIAQTIQYGPHWNGEEFTYAVGAAYLDRSIFDAWGPISVPPGDPAAYIAGLHTRTDVTRRDATVARLYRAVLGRKVEAYGYQYWRERLVWGEISTTRVAEVMTRSAEFRATYGSLGNQAFVEQLYLNVLGRAGAPGDVAYWTNRLDAGESRGRIVLLITESAENRVRSQATIDVEVMFLNLLGRVPVAYEAAEWAGRSLVETAYFLLHSHSYAQRWRTGYGEPVLPGYAN